MVWTLYPNSLMRSQTASTSSLLACGFIEIIMVSLLLSLLAIQTPSLRTKKPYRCGQQKTHSFEWVGFLQPVGLEPTPLYPDRVKPQYQ
jgi:hypothetical protein